LVLSSFLEHSRLFLARSRDSACVGFKPGRALEPYACAPEIEASPDPAHAPRQYEALPGSTHARLENEAMQGAYAPRMPSWRQRRCRGVRMRPRGRGAAWLPRPEMAGQQQVPQEIAYLASAACSAPTRTLAAGRAPGITGTGCPTDRRSRQGAAC